MAARQQRFGELELVDWVCRRARAGPEVVVGPGDDAAALRLPPGELCVLTTDSVVEGVHYDPATTSAKAAGRKAVARCVSDLAAMAARPVAVVVALQLSRDTAPARARQIMSGVLQMTERIGIALVGGDVASSDGPTALNVTGLGTAPKDRIVLRWGARPGDLLCVTGELGGSILGRHLNFTPRVAEALWIVAQAKVHAMMDISDGLLLDAWRMARASRVGMVLDPARLPISPAARRLSRSSGQSAVEHALSDGEDYELLFAVSPKTARALLKQRRPPVRISAIGQVVAQPGLWLRDEQGRRVRCRPRGWVHGLGPRPTA
jgi:thiamine-monophosphate kinase